MLTAFEVHKLNDTGLAKARIIAQEFQQLYEDIILNTYGDPIENVNARELAIVRTKLEEAYFYAKKAMAMQKVNQV